MITYNLYNIFQLNEPVLLRLKARPTHTHARPFSGEAEQIYLIETYN